MGPAVNIELHYSHLCNDFKGIAVCAVFGCATFKTFINWRFIVNGKEISSPDLPDPRANCITIASDHILLSYSSTTDLNVRFSKSLVEDDANGLCQIGIRFEIGARYTGSDSDSGKIVKKCGVRLLYEKDMDLDSDSDSKSTLVKEDNKVKRRRDEYDGAGPSGEGSSNDVPHPKRIERPTEFGNSDFEESSDVMCCNTCLFFIDVFRSLLGC